MSGCEPMLCVEIGSIGPPLKQVKSLFFRLLSLFLLFIPFNASLPQCCDPIQVPQGPS